jgi:CDP-diacylglycerol--serine O-phosphatidyltransferase
VNSFRHAIPNLLTLGNLMAGCFAILNVFNHNMLGEDWGRSVDWSVTLIFLAAGFDLLDGLVARLLGVQSALGAQLDSLADVVSFGVAPGMLLAHIVIGSHAYLFADAFLMRLAVFATMFIPAFSALRLAIFNLDERQQSGFRGLPTPANALFIACLPLILRSPAWGNIAEQLLGPYMMIGMCLGLSALLVLPLPLMALKFKGGFQPRQHWPLLVLGALSALAIALLGWAAAPVMLVLYLGLSLVQAYSRRQH